jgi:hypothetical protein
MTLNGAAKLALAFGLSAIGVKMLKDKDIVPVNPFKTECHDPRWRLSQQT